MSLGKNLFQARKQNRFSQEDIAEKLGISRQTVSKWETDESLPDIQQAKNLALLYHLSLDELVEFDADINEIEQVIENTSEEVQQKIDWSKLWGKKYPVLLSYPKEVRVQEYAKQLRALLERLKKEYGYGETDALLVLKDILAHVWKQEEL